MHRLCLTVLTLVCLATGVPASGQGDSTALLGALRTPGHLGLMRHSTAPGFDDPPNFRIGDCTTQRNLSQGGRAQAERIGGRLNAGGLGRIRLVSSQWCRALDTARLMGVGPVEELRSLNSLVSYPGQSAEMTGATRGWIQQQELTIPTILVTHQVNIQALVGALPDEGDIVVVQRTRSGDLRVVGTLAAD